MKYLFLISTLILSGSTVYAQSDSLHVVDVIDNYWVRDSAGSVEIFQSASIAALMDTLIAVEVPIEGYRIQLSFGKKEEVNEIRTEFLQQHPDCRAYVSWLQPNFRLRIGDFRTRLQAERFKRGIMDDYPNCYIVRDHIEPFSAEKK